MLNKITNYLRSGNHPKAAKSAEKRAQYKAVLFRAWELEFLAKAARTQHSYECPEYSSEEDKAVFRLIKKLESNFQSQAKKEGQNA